MAWVSLDALLTAQAFSDGDQWIKLITVEHPIFSQPLRLASWRIETVTSLGRIFQPTRFDVGYPSEQFDETARASVVFDGVDGTILDAIQGLRPRPVATLEIVLESDPNTIIFQAPDFEISNLLQEGLTSTILELEVGRAAVLPFPGINMDRTRMAGMFTDL